MSKAAGAAYSEASSAADQAKAAMECVANSETKIKDTKKELVKVRFVLGIHAFIGAVKLSPKMAK